MTVADGDSSPEPGDITAAIEILARESGMQPEAAARLVSVVASFSGPMPPPNVLAAYDNLIPGSADRILSMAEREQAFRHKVTESAVAGSGESETSQRRYAFAVVVVMVAAALACVVMDAPQVAVVLGGGTLLGLVTVFLGGRYIEQRQAGEAAEPASGQSGSRA